MDTKLVDLALRLLAEIRSDGRCDHCGHWRLDLLVVEAIDSYLRASGQMPRRGVTTVNAGDWTSVDENTYGLAQDEFALVSADDHVQSVEVCKLEDGRLIHLRQLQI